MPVAKKYDIDINDLRARLIYNGETGKLFWRHNGAEAGLVGNRGYVKIKFRSRCWLAHVLVWAYVHGEVPTMQIDHINRDPADNRLSNLRLVTPSENMANRAVSQRYFNGRLIRPGIIFNRAERKFKAQTRVDGKRFHIGTFASLDDAEAAVAKAEGRS